MNSPSVTEIEKSTHPMRFLVFGAGAIGTYVGGSLLLGGHHVVFLDRKPTIEHLGQTGMRLILQGKRYTLPNPVLTESLAKALELGPLDAAIFALKSFDTLTALDELMLYQRDLPPILCLQNGVENEALIAEKLGKDKVIAGTVTSAIGRREQGEIQLERLRGIGIADTQPLSKDLASAFNTSSLNAHLYPSAEAMKWSKLLTNLIANASSAILSMTPGEIFSHPGLYRLEILQLRETLAVMDALKIPVINLPATPVRLLEFAARRLPLWLSRPLLRRAVGRGRGGKMPSFYLDLHSGRGKSEVDYLNGAVVRFAEKTSIPAPTNRLLTETLIGMVEGRISIEQYARQPEQLLRRGSSAGSA